jgi:hypothetical protein
MTAPPPLPCLGGVACLIRGSAWAILAPSGNPRKRPTASGGAYERVFARAFLCNGESYRKFAQESPQTASARSQLRRRVSYLRAISWQTEKVISSHDDQRSRRRRRSHGPGEVAKKQTANSGNAKPPFRRQLTPARRLCRWTGRMLYQRCPEARLARSGKCRCRNF